MQQTNWQPYIEMYKELFDESPTRVLDDMNVALDKPSAFEKSISKHFDGCIGSHIIFSFIGTANSDMLLEIQRHTSINIISRESTEERDTFIFIATANLLQWRMGLNTLSSKSKKIREFSQRCLTFLKMAGYSI